MCFVYLHPTQARDPAAPEGGSYCSREGTFGPGATRLRSLGFGTRDISQYDQSYVGVLGVESAGSWVVWYTGPRGSRIYSPVTSLIEPAGDQARVKRALGISGSLFALLVDRDLTTFDPVAALASSDADMRRDASRLAAANLRAKATAASLSVVRGGDVPNPYFSNHFDVDYPRLGALIAANDAFLFENARMTAILESLVPAGRYRPDVLSAAAHLIDAYASTIGVEVPDSTTAAELTLGISGYLEPELAALLQANTAAAAAAAQAVTSGAIRARTAAFRDTVPFPTTGFFFPSPNFFVGAAGTPLSIRAGAAGSTSIVDNDLYANDTTTGPTGLFPGMSTVVSVSVPAASAANVTATLSGDTITAGAVGGFQGTTYFDYRVRHPSGEEGTARIYVLFR